MQRRAQRGAGEAVSLTAADLIEVMADVCWKREVDGAAGTRVTPATLGHLRALRYEQPCATEFRATDLAHVTSFTPAAATKILKELLIQDVVAFVRQKGSSR